MIQNLKYLVSSGLLALLFLAGGCGKDEKVEYVDTLTVVSTAELNTPFKVKRMYICDHTNYLGRNHIHPSECNTKYCPPLNKDGSPPDRGPKPPGSMADCPEQRFSGIGIKLGLATMSTNSGSILTSLHRTSSNQLATEIANRVSSNVEVSSKLNKKAQGSLSFGLQRDIGASFSRQWGESYASQVNSKFQTIKSEMLDLALSINGEMGCAQRREVGIDFTIQTKATLFASASVKGRVDKDGNWTTTEIRWINFTVDITMGLVGEGLVDRTITTSCNCKPLENHDHLEGAPKRPRSVPRENPLPPETHKRTVFVESENLDDFKATVFVVDETKAGDGTIEKMTVLVPMAAAGGFALYELVANRNGRGSHAATGPNAMKSPRNDTIAYEVPESADGTYDVEGLDRDGNPLVRDAHKLGTVNGRDIVVLDNSDRAFHRLDRLTGADTEYDLSSLTVELKVQPQQRMGTLLRGVLVIHASPAAAKKYRFDVIIHAPGFQPRTIPVEDLEANVPFPLERLNIVAMKPGSNDISVELLPTKR